MCQVGETSRARQLAADVLDKDQATPEGYVILGSEYADFLLRAGELAQAFDFYDWIAKEAPTHRKAAPSHYWLALRSLKQGNTTNARYSALAARKCYSLAPALLAEWETDAAALLILHGCDIEQTSRDPGAARYDSEFLRKQHVRIKDNISRL